MTKKELLSIKKWYHATTNYACESIMKNKVLAHLNIGVPRDFGSGFYLNSDLDWSFNYILNNMCGGDEELAKSFAVLEISFNIGDALKMFGEDSLLLFEEQSPEYAKFVYENRVNIAKFEYYKQMVAGPMASAEQIMLLEEYSKKMADSEKYIIAVLQGKEKEVQLLLHTQAICDMINVKKDIVAVHPWNRRC